MSRHKQKYPMESKTIAFFVMGFILLNLIIEFPFLIVLIIVAFFKFDLNINKILKTFGVTDYLKKNYGNYDEIISQLKLNKTHTQRIEKNRKKRREVERFYAQPKQQSSTNAYPSYREEKLEIMKAELDQKKHEQSSFYEHNKKTLQEKFSQNIDNKKSFHKTEEKKYSWRDAVSNKSANKNNFFGNNKKPKTFGSGKSIWDNYESVTEKFSTNNK